MPSDVRQGYTTDFKNSIWMRPVITSGIKLNECVLGGWVGQRRVNPFQEPDATAKIDFKKLSKISDFQMMSTEADQTHNINGLKQFMI